MAQRNQTTRRPRGMISNLLRNVQRRMGGGVGTRVRNMVGNLTRRGTNRTPRANPSIVQGRGRDTRNRPVQRDIGRGPRQDFGTRRRT